MIGVLRPGARLILVDHIESSARVARAVPRALEILTVPLGGEHFLRRLSLARSAPRSSMLNKFSDSNAASLNAWCAAGPPRPRTVGTQ